ncbi:MAG: efflux RND transporter permease subunit, partial [Acidobacteria bacterium]|nr:efflux RND transporter permease subunit [Acidobacteriota bacterium]
PVQLGQIAEEIKVRLMRNPRVAQVRVIGGARRVVKIALDRERLAAHGVSILQAHQVLTGLNWRLPAGSFSTGDTETQVEVGSLFRSASEVGAAVLAAPQGKPVYLRDVATVTDGAEDPVSYAWMMQGDVDAPAVTIAVSKKPGTNAVELVKELESSIARLKGPVVPSNAGLVKTRDYGKTAGEKSAELMFHMGLATISVVLLMALFLGRREALVVLVAVPTTLALTLFSSYLFGYTLNRVTLFALIFAIGILVDDAIVVVENIHRHYELGWTSPREATFFAVDEVGNPTILATFAVVAALLPLAFVSGLMGPYMQPIPINASAAMVFSLLVAFVISPWLTFKLFRKYAEQHLVELRPSRAAHLQPHAGAQGGTPGAAASQADVAYAPGDETPEEDRLHRFYAKLFRPLLASAPRRWALLGGVVALLLGSMALVAVSFVKVKMLPYDNKSELQVVVDMPEGTTLEKTANVARELASAVRTLPEVTDVQIYAGTSAPFNFNGLVRHYFLRSGPLVADLQVNLAAKEERSRESHDLAKAVRTLLAPIGAARGANVKVTEVPPGPPVLSTLVAEVYGPELEARVALAAEVRK